MNKLIFPQELEVWYLLPAIRKRLALGLIKEGFSQKKIAEIMHVTEATISQYKKEKRANKDFLGTTYDGEFTNSIKKINDNSKSFFSEVMKLNTLIKKSGILCELHKIMETNNPACDNCGSNNGSCI